MKDPIDIARDWLKQSREGFLGPSCLWTEGQSDKYHSELGLLVDFVTDCWPKQEDGKANNLWK